MRDILIDLLIERHDAADGAHRDLWSCQQAPDAELAGIGMALLELVALFHDRGRREEALPRGSSNNTFVLLISIFMVYYIVVYK
jgi:hypothetical protein